MPPRAAVVSAAVCAAVLLSTAGLGAQDVPTFTTRSDLVALTISVEDSSGHYVQGLPQAAFTVLENGTPQSIRLFTSGDVPVTAGLIVDSSVSMMRIRHRVIAAVAAFAGASKPGDELFAIAFNEDVHPVLPVEAPFTSDPAVIERALDAADNAIGRTALFDAVAAGLDYVARGRYSRKILVVISDGGDNASSTTADVVIQATRTSNAVIDTVVLRDPDDHDSNPRLLRRLAGETGGITLSPSDADNIAPALTRMAATIRRAYTIGYAPSAPPDGTYRRIEVRVAAPGHGHLTARTRAGYVAALPDHEAADAAR